jgi:two-component system response regulator BasR
MHYFVAAEDRQNFGAEPPLPILLLEPYRLLAKPLVRGLAEEGIVAHVARSDAEADARMRATSYAAVVVDWNVHRQGSAALVRRWRQDGVTVPVLMLVPSGSDAELLAARAAGADSALPLLFSFADLLTHLRAWIGPRRAPVYVDA